MDFDTAAHVIVIVLLLIILWKMFRAEMMGGTIYTSGADQRFDQRFSSTDQGTSFIT
jgi:hypothetical protein